MKAVLLSLLSLSLLTSCANFSGMGNYRTGSGYKTVSDARKYYKPAGDFQIRWPVRKVKVSQSFKPRKNPRHEGVDFIHYRGAPVLAAHEGYVVFAGRKYRGYGKMIILEYNKQWATLYAHLDEVLVSKGDVIEPGQLIGKLGNTGRSTGAHLHFELIKNKQPINPLPYLKGQRRLANY